MKIKILENLSNVFAVLLLITLIAAPVYFAENFSKVAGVKSESAFLVISQVEKFPQMTLIQTQNKYTISFEKLASKQAFLAILIINNPTETTKTYQIISNEPGDAVFFGDNINNLAKEISLPKNVSVPISLLATVNNTDKGEIEFTINSK